MLAISEYSSLVRGDENRDVTLALYAVETQNWNLVFALNGSGAGRYRVPRMDDAEGCKAKH